MQAYEWKTYVPVEWYYFYLLSGIIFTCWVWVSRYIRR